MMKKKIKKNKIKVIRNKIISKLYIIVKIMKKMGIIMINKLKSNLKKSILKMSYIILYRINNLYAT